MRGKCSSQSSKKRSSIRKKLLLLVLSMLWASPALAQNPDSIPFAPAVNYGTLDNPIPIFCADLDGDLDLDLVVPSWNIDSVSILKNNGDGTFQAKVDYGLAYYCLPISIFCADLDGDTDLDLAVVSWTWASVSILKNNGDGTFQTGVDYGAGSRPYSIFCADLDGDTDLDLAVANSANADVSILKNNGDGTFQTKVDYDAGYYPTSVFCADLDGDTDLDLAVGHYHSDTLSILKNNGDGTFQTRVDYIVGADPHQVFCADLDGDTDLDLAVAHANSSNVSILKNNGDGTFQTKVDYAVGDGPTSVFCADLDGDTDLDLAVVNSNSDNVSILRNLSIHPLSYTFWLSAYSPVDLIVTDRIGDSIGVSFNTIQNGSTYDTTQDLNNDGDKDDRVVIPSPVNGEYMVRVVPESVCSGNYTLAVKLDQNEERVVIANAPCPEPGQVDTVVYNVPEYLHGDANRDGQKSVSDVVFLINYLFKGGPAPDPANLGDVNFCKQNPPVEPGQPTVADVVYMINYLFKGGKAPCS